MNRRDFLGVAGLGVAALALPDWVTGADFPRRQGKIVPADRKLRIACVGSGGQAGTDINGVSSENIVALCDVDFARAEGMFKRFSGAKRYKDYRQMLVEMDDQIDAVTVTTPDHTHFPVAMMAISMGKHVYVQKPLAHTVAEARAMTEAARKHQVITQMGNQGHAKEGARMVREWVQAGAIGDVREVYFWTNRPIWPQGIDRPAQSGPAPATLDWNRWLGVAPERPYNPCYLPFNWRGWWDFGCGALGDMGCHIMDAAFWALDLKYPTSVEAVSSPVNNETAPSWSVITYEFPARGSMPPVKVVWSDGGKLPPRPKELEPNRQLPRGGQLIVGDKGTIMDTSDYCESPRLIPEEKMREFIPNRPPPTIPRVPGGSPYQEWIRGCKGGPMPGSNFDYSGPLTEMVLIGNLAIRLGKRIEWNGRDMVCANDPQANALVRKPYRVF
jgi:predicted dehydrogenase